MEEKERKAELARRIAEALRYYGGFIYEDDIDKHRDVMDIIHRTGLALALTVTIIDPKKRIYALTPRERKCTTICENQCHRDDKCISDCIFNCRRENINKIAEVLEEFARRNT